MVEITDKEFEQFQLLKKIFIHTQPERTGTYFICGEAGKKNVEGLPEFISVCPAAGLDRFTMYKKH